MITRELALNVLKELAVFRFEYCINEKKLSEEEAIILSKRLYNHCLVVGTIAEKISNKIGLNDERSYIFGLLHDIGKFKPNRFHGLTGYEIALENNDLELAQICITHSFINNRIEEFHFPDNEFKKTDIKRTKELFKSIKLNDYIYLIKLCDFMSIGDTLNSSTIEDRLIDIITRYPMSQTEFDRLSKNVNKLKEYFEKKYDFDLYKLLEHK